MVEDKQGDSHAVKKKLSLQVSLTEVLVTFDLVVIENASRGDDTLVLFTRLQTFTSRTKYISRRIGSFRGVRSVSKALNGEKGSAVMARGEGGDLEGLLSTLAASLGVLRHSKLH